jgi:cation:H+ antiporter
VNPLQAWMAGSPWAAAVVLLGAFAVLAKSADLFVGSSVALANRFRIPRLVIGLVLVSLATTMPELTVSTLSAARGIPEMAMGNAVGSIICNTGLGLALCALVSAAPVAVIPHVLKTSGGFLLAVALLALGFTLPDRTLSGWEGLVLVILSSGYFAYLFRQHTIGRYHDDVDLEAADDHLHLPLPRLAFLFALALAGIFFSSDLVVGSATVIARAFGVPESVIALTLVAFGTSIPEVMTCVAAARRREGALAIGNILGANIINICWVTGFSSLIQDLTLSPRELALMFPAMFAILLVALGLLRLGYRLTRFQGIILLSLYGAYLAGFIFFGAGAAQP